jgi:hypothetical protein
MRSDASEGASLRLRRKPAETGGKIGQTRENAAFIAAYGVSKCSERRFGGIKVGLGSESTRHRGD